jgi:hypothetical protein
MAEGQEIVGRVPERKPDGREGPPRNYPKDPEAYADPRNWKYPVHTPFHARAARRYFDRPENRRKYTPEERKYIDWRIDEALKRFGVIEGREEEDRRVPFDKEVEEMDLHDLLLYMVGGDRLRRAAEIPAQEVTLERRPGSIAGTVKEYPVRIDLQDKRIIHNCGDWQRRSGVGLLCKHLARVFQVLPEQEAVRILRRLVRERERWIFQVG